MASRGDLKTFELGLHLRLREEPLLGRLGTLGLARALEDNLVLLVLVEERLLVVDGARGDLHLHGVLLGVLLDLLQVLVVAVLRQPGDDVTLRPVDLERVLVLVVNVVLPDKRQLVSIPEV